MKLRVFCLCVRGVSLTRDGYCCSQVIYIYNFHYISHRMCSTFPFMCETLGTGHRHFPWGPDVNKTKHTHKHKNKNKKTKTKRKQNNNKTKKVFMAKKKKIKEEKKSRPPFRHKRSDPLSPWVNPSFQLGNL